MQAIGHCDESAPRAAFPAATPDSADEAFSSDEGQLFDEGEISALLDAIKADDAFWGSHNDVAWPSIDSKAPSALSATPPPTSSVLRASPTTKRPRPTGDSADLKRSPPRMRTYTARKKEIEALAAELPSLEAYVDYLKHQAAKVNNQCNSTQKQRLVNSCLRDKAHKQQLALARVHSALSEFTQTRQGRLLPMDTFLHLVKDKQQRRDTLCARETRVLGDARRFLKERTGFMDLRVPSMEKSCFVSRTGDHCALEFAVSPLEGFYTARQVFDALQSHWGRTNAMSSVVLDGPDDNGGDIEINGTAISQRRMLRATSSGFQVESNEVLHAHFDEQNDEFGDGREYGLLVIDCVDKDELHPYAPETRLRLDVVSMCSVRTFIRDVASAQHPGGPQTRLGVVVTRSSFLKLHRTALPLSAHEMHEVLDGLATREKAVFDAVWASLQSSAHMI